MAEHCNIHNTVIFTSLAAQSATLNRQDWRDMERYLEAEIKAGKTVNLKIDMGYPTLTGSRPSEFRVIATIEGKVVPFRFIQ